MKLSCYVLFLILGATAATAGSLLPATLPNLFSQTDANISQNLGFIGTNKVARLIREVSGGGGYRLYETDTVTGGNQLLFGGLLPPLNSISVSGDGGTITFEANDSNQI